MFSIGTDSLPTLAVGFPGGHGGAIAHVGPNSVRIDTPRGERRTSAYRR